MMNSVNLIGNVGKAPEIKTFESGKKVARFSVAISTGKDKKPVWVNCEMWDEAVNRLQKCEIKKGSRIAVSGSLAQNEFTIEGETTKTLRRLYLKVFSFTALQSRDDAAMKAAEPEAADVTTDADDAVEGFDEEHAA